MPLIIYKNEKGVRVPSVSAVLAQWGAKTQALIYWAYKQGEQGVPLYEKKEADVGTLAHMMIDADIKDKQMDLSEFPADIVDQAQQCLSNYSEWRQRHNFVPIETELSLVSERHQYGGTIDCVAMVDDKLSIVDWKTGKEVYEDHIVQLVAYAHLWRENFPEPEHQLTGGYHIIRTGKAFAMFEYKWYADFPGAWSAFLHLRELYNLSKKIKQLK